MIKDLEFIIDDFFIEIKLNRFKYIIRYDGIKYDYYKYKDGFDVLVKEIREVVVKVDEFWKNKIVKKYEEIVIKFLVVKEEKKVEEF